MGVDVQILVEHTLSPDVDGSALNRILRPCLDVIVEDDDFWRPHRRHFRPLPEDPDAFTWLARSVDPEDACFLEVEGPWGISFHIGTHLILASTVLRWHQLIHDAPTQHAIVRLFRTFTACVGGHRWTCYPDSSYRHAWVSGSLYEGENMDQALLWLDTRCGPPASSISAIATWLTDEEMRREYPELDGDEESRIGRADGYWVDRLAKSP
jgi:hypothetical protein